MHSFIPCIPKELSPADMLLAAADAVMENPSNAPPEGAAALIATALVDEAAELMPQRIAFLTGMYWGPGGVDLTTGFMEPLSNELRDKFMHYLNAIGQEGGRKVANVRFRWTQTDPMVRITREGDGYWSYLGVGIKRIPKNQPTMCLQGFTLNTPESEWRRVVPHEGLHTCGAPHEHLRREIVQRIDPEKAYAYFGRMGWSRGTTQSNVLTPLDERSIMATPEAAEDSVMTYWLPGEIMKDGRPVLGGKYLTDHDRAFIAKMYPVAPPSDGHKIYLLAPGATSASLADAATANVTLTTTNDPGAVTLTVKPTTNGGTSVFEWLQKISAIFAAIKAGDWFKVLELLTELGRAQQAGQIPAEVFEMVQQSMAAACAQAAPKK